MYSVINQKWKTHDGGQGSLGWTSQGVQHLRLYGNMLNVKVQDSKIRNRLRRYGLFGRIYQWEASFVFSEKNMAAKLQMFGHLSDS